MGKTRFSLEDICRKKKTCVSVRLEDELIVKLEKLAKESNRSRSNVINYLLKLCVDDAEVVK